MASLEFDCSVEQGFNFQKDVQDVVGHINTLKIGDKELASDLAVTDPEAVDGDNVNVVGIVSSIDWNGGYAEPMVFSCRISVYNKQDAMLLAHTSLSDTTVEFTYTIYDFDLIKKQYYKCFHTNGKALKGLIAKSGGDLEFRVDRELHDTVTSPMNFMLNLEVIPQEDEQETNCAVSVDGKFVKKWGVKVG